METSEFEERDLRSGDLFYVPWIAVGKITHPDIPRGIQFAREHFSNTFKG